MASTKSSKKNIDTKITTVFEVDPTECPFREFRDNELSAEFWGLGPAACRATMLQSKAVSKPPAEFVWIDDQTQPLPRSVRRFLHGWIRAEDLAESRWDAEVVIFEENNGGKMSVADTQLGHAQVLLRSSFCRQVLSACYILERIEGFMVEHQWENFMFAMGPEGWRARHHIYSPGLKSGGGPQHRPVLSKNGCYLVRLFYVGAWRCVWVNDQIPVDATDSPLLPFSPLLSMPVAKPGTKSAPSMLTANTVYLWPLLLCKALLKLAAPDMNSDEDLDNMEDEPMPHFDIMHALTGSLNVTYIIQDMEELWQMVTSQLPVFSWDDDDDTVASTVKSKSTKKPTTKETVVTRRHCMVTILIDDTENYPVYALPGITPGHEMTLLTTMARDLPLKKPLPEPDVALWKYHRWVDWAKGHGLYEAYDCPRTQYLKVNGLLKMSYSPHLLDVQSTDSITHGFREEQDKTNPPPMKKGPKDLAKAQTDSKTAHQALKDELKEWIRFAPIFELTKQVNVIYFPSMFEFTSVASCPPVRITKAPPNRAIDIVPPTGAPLYLQIDGPEENRLKISLAMLHPRVLVNSGIPVVEHIEPAYVFLERFDWFGDCEIPVAKAYVETMEYASVEVDFLPGRHFCRLWIHSRMNWHVMLMSESDLLLGTRDLIQSAAVRECPWAARFLSHLGSSFSNWTRGNRSNAAMLVQAIDREFFRSYQPDLYWDPAVVGYNQALLHWMFRQALQSLLLKRLPTADVRPVFSVLRHYFCDPDLGLPPKPRPSMSLRELANMDPCDCTMPEVEEMEQMEEQLEEQLQNSADVKPLVDPLKMARLFTPPIPPVTSQICELASEELPCGVLKDERDKVIRQHEAAICLQSHWRGTWARQCLHRRTLFSPDVMKLVMEHAFGNLESLSALMNEFFGMYPGAKQAYSVASALSGVYGLTQFHGVSLVTKICKWIPYFQVVFYCHAPVKVHFDIQSSLQYSTVVVYNNDNGKQLPQTYNAHTTFDFQSNGLGYTIMAHGTLNQPVGTNTEAHWQLTILSSIDGVFHCCDNDLDGCHEIAFQSAYKLHIDEIFLPNRRNILGGILVSVTKYESMSFRAAATSPDLEIEARLCSKVLNEVHEIARCSGKGEIYWPFIRLAPHPPPESIFSMKKKSMSHASLNARDSVSIGRPRPSTVVRPSKPSSAGRSMARQSIAKLRDRPVPVEPKQYCIEVTAPTGWALTLAQWMRVDEVRNSYAVEQTKIEVVKKSAGKDKPPSSAKEKALPIPPTVQPLPDDAYIELECSLAINGGAYARRDDERDQEFAAARRAWDAKEPGRNLRGAQIRKEFRSEFLVALPPPPSESTFTMEESYVEEGEGETKDQQQQGPTPATESGLLEMTVESEEEAKFFFMPEQLKDKFIPLYFLPFCMKNKNEEEGVLITLDMAEAAKKDRHARIEAAIERMRELQLYNEHFVLGRQKRRCCLLEKLCVDAHWCPELSQVLEERDEAIALETLNRTLSATKKKQEAKTKQDAKVKPDVKGKK